MFPVTKIQRFCTKDGPGIRTTVFLKGCPLRCAWCHNPETQSRSARFFYSDNLCVRCGACAEVCPSQAHRVNGNGHILDRGLCAECMKCVSVCPAGALESCADYLSEDEIFNEVMKDAAFYSAGGGVTFSGGEPTVHADKLIPLLKRFKNAGLHTAIETCGYFDQSLLPGLVDSADLFLWDIKDTDDNRHFSNTGVHNGKIISNLKTADSMGANTVIRCILLKSVNTDTVHLQAIAGIYRSLKHCAGAELLPYHTYGVSKNIQLGLKRDPRPDWIPTEEDIRFAKDYLLQHGVTVINN